MDISVIVPVLNEADNVTRLLTELTRQQGASIQIILVDGGSVDTTQTLLASLSSANDNVEWCCSIPGRGAQMNAGVRLASADTLLFLHADSRITNLQLIAEGLYQLNKSCDQRNTDQLAGHFGVRFDRSNIHNDRTLFFYEAKTHLNRLDCINGDQGIMIRKVFFEQLGAFDESLGYMEDLRLARKVSRRDGWISLPGTLITSTRRFEVEGLAQRQVLNSFLKCFDEIGFHEYFEAAAGAYRHQEKSAQLMLAPFCDLAQELLAKRGIAYMAGTWYRIGCYVAANGWQLAFLLDCYRCSGDPGVVQPRTLAFYDRWLAPLVTSAPSSLVTAILTFAWVGWIRLFGPRPRRIR